MNRDAPLLDSAVQDTILQAVTNEYYYSEHATELEVDNQVYQVSQSRLIARSSYFKGLLSLPQADGPVDKTPPLHLDVGASEWKEYLWFVHADPVTTHAFLVSPASTQNCARYLGIAVVAHRYDAMVVATWAIAQALAMLKQPNRSFEVDAEIARLLLSVASRWHGESAVTIDCRDIVCDALHPSRGGELARDPIAALGIARDDTFVLAHVYFYILRNGYDYNWEDDPRLKLIDHQRLLQGFRSLSRIKNSGGSHTRPGAVARRLPVRAIRTLVAAYVRAAVSAPMDATVLAARAFFQRARRGPSPPNGRAIAPAPASELALPPVTGETWHPRLDWQIPHPREELWSYFDEQRGHALGI